MDTIFIILTLLAMLGVIAGVIMLFIKSRRKWGLFAIIGSFLVLAIGAGGMDRSAKSAGFIDLSDQTAAKEAGYTSAEEWAKVREKMLEERASAKTTAYEQDVPESAEEKLVTSETSAQAAEPTEEISRDQRLKAHVRRLARKIYDKYEIEYGVKPVVYRPDDAICQENNFCSFHLSDVYVTLTGVGWVQAKFNNQISPAQYREICAFLFSTLADSDPALGKELVKQFFSLAASAGQAKADVQGISVKVKPNSSNYFECEYIKLPW